MHLLQGVPHSVSSRSWRLSLSAAYLLCSASVLSLSALPACSSAESSSGLVGRFLHITDIHPDEHYLNGAAVSTFCHTILSTSQDDANGSLRSFLDEDGDKPAVGGYYGAPHTMCDSPFTLANATFDWIDKNLVGSIDFVVWTGDNARHDYDKTHPRTQDQINEMNDVISKKFLSAFPVNSIGKRLPIVPSIGNNDVYPHNIMHPGPNPILKHYATIWSEFIPESQLHTFRHGGYHSSEVIPGKIAVISLNTLYFYIHNAAVDGCKLDKEPGTEQMIWLETELKRLRRRNMVAYLTGHVPPEKNSYSPTCYSRYTRIALKYSDVIVGHLYGHANIDHFFLLSENKKGRAGKQEGAEEVEEEERRVISVMDEEDYDPFHALGLTSYMDTLWKQYQKIPEKAELDKYAIVQVAPSVVPTYHPTLRIFTYQLTTPASDGTKSVEFDQSSELLNAQQGDEEEDEDDEDDEMSQKELEEYFAAVLNRDSEIEDLTMYKKTHRGKKPRRYPHAVTPSTFGFPLGYTQYWSNLTLANDGPATAPQYEIEYRTREDYGLQDLGVASWLDLAKRMTKDEDLKTEYLQRMFVQTGAETLLG
ncbi:Endopolyphosphatase [Mortierella sp. GBA30]|nr:Endopolyphosphatase [Mortierella sp. GBA30]